MYILYIVLLSFTALLFTKVRVSPHLYETPLKNCFEDFSDCLAAYVPSVSRNVSSVVDLCTQCKELRGEDSALVDDMICRGKWYCDNIEGVRLSNN
jgi:hypothetical protein